MESSNCDSIFLKKVNVTEDTSITPMELLELNGYTVQSFISYQEIEILIKKISAELIKTYESTSDLIECILNSEKRSTNQIRYKLHPPFTASIADSEIVFEHLLDLDLISDIFYSNRSRTYSIDISINRKYDFNDIIRFGVSELLPFKPSRIFSKILFSKDKNSALIDLAYIKDDQLNIYHVELASEYDKEIPEHIEKLNALKRRIVNERIKLSSVKVNEYWIVSETTKALLSPLENVISLSSLIDNSKNDNNII